MLQKVYRALDEFAQVMTLQKSVAEQGKVDKLLYYRLSCRILAYHLGFFFAQFVGFAFKLRNLLVVIVA